MSRSASHPAESALCLGCRLCCDGTVFEHVVLREGEEGPLQAVLPQITRVTRKDKPAFLQPCPADCAVGCRIYPSRPGVCRDFACATLLQLREGAIDHAEARRRISEIKAQREQLVQACGVTTPTQAYGQLAAISEAASDTGERLPTSMFDLLILQRLVDIYLRPADNAVTMGGRRTVAGES